MPVSVIAPPGLTAIMAATSIMAAAHPATPNGSAPLCEHLNELAPAAPQSDHCRECRACAGRWQSLRLCLSCGWVACSDDSPNQHARAHYQETDHPLTRGLDLGDRRRWCYVHQRAV
jgi:uncharacterized UBP type Zn finger protein